MRTKVFFAGMLVVASLAVPAYTKLQQILLRTSNAEEANAHGHTKESSPKGSHPPGHDSHGEGEQGEHRPHRIIATSPVAKDVTIPQEYVCQIHSCRHIEVRALESGYLEKVNVREGQTVKAGDVLFNILPTLYLARRDADLAEAQLAQVEFDNTKQLVEKNIVSVQQLKLAKAKLDKALAQVKLAQAELNFAEIKAPFEGIVDRLHEQNGSLIEEGTMLTTLSDNSTMWVYFNVPEARYLEYQHAMKNKTEDEHLTVELRLANHTLFPETGVIGAIEADFDNETGNIAFRADFANPEALLRHGQTGTIIISQVAKDAVVIPQRATYEILAKRYVYVLDQDNVVRQREIQIDHELDDIYVVRGLKVSEKIVLEGARQVRDGDHVACDYQSPDEVLSNLKYHAE